MQAPETHSSLVHGTPSSEQLEPFARNPFGGQVVVVPLQVSAASQSVTAARHTVP
jgi:hypothetical protein